jgi:hypothetical protein
MRADKTFLALVLLSLTGCKSSKSVEASPPPPPSLPETVPEAPPVAPPEPEEDLRDPLLVDPDHLQGLDLLEGWRWKTGAGARTVGVSLTGRLFFVAEDGSVQELDPARARVVIIAATQAGWRQALQDPATRADMFEEETARALTRALGPPGPLECFGYVLAPLVGGDESPMNRELMELVVHFSELGQVARQVAGISEGTP